MSLPQTNLSVDIVRGVHRSPDPGWLIRKAWAPLRPVCLRPGEPFPVIWRWNLASEDLCDEPYCALDESSCGENLSPAGEVGSAQDIDGAER